MNDSGKIDFKKALQAFINMSNNINERINLFLNDPEVKENIIKFTEFLNRPEVIEGIRRLANLPENQKKIIENMSKEGWFPFYECLLNYFDESETIDSFMSRVIDINYDSIKNQLIEAYSERAHILETAFKLYDMKNYIAAIPLFLMQIDGIPEQKGYGFYFTGFAGVEKFPKQLQKALEEDKLDQESMDLFNNIIINANNALISKSTHSIKSSDSDTALNRNGILHGNRNFLHYGNEVNAKKCISLLMYINLMLDDLGSSST